MHNLYIRNKNNTISIKNPYIIQYYANHIKFKPKKLEV
jgi:hypothetical protein